MSSGERTFGRRTALKALGAAGATAAGVGLGVTSFAASGAATRVAIGANDPGRITNDRGDVSRVTVDPTFRVEWENFDEAVGKVFYVVEAKVGGQGRFWPVFRSTPWLLPDSVAGVANSKPGTTGFLEFSAPLSTVLARATAARSDPERDGDDGGPDADWPDLPLPRPLTVVDRRGRPNYRAFFDAHSVPGSNLDAYLDGVSIGDAPAAMLTAATGPGDPLALVNHFPGAASGAYGAAAGTGLVDNGRDGTADATTVELRYTFALYTVNGAMLNAVSDPVGTGWFEHVRQTDVRSGDQFGHSTLVMNGEDGYPDLRNNGGGSAATNSYDVLQTVAGSHPSVVVERASFDVTVVNEQADAGVTGDTNPGASGGGQ